MTGPDSSVQASPVARPERRRAPSVVLPTPRRSTWHLALSIALHLGLVGLLVYAQWRGLMTWQEILGPGSPAHEGGGGGGGGNLRMVAITAPSRGAPRVSASAAETPAPVPPPPAATQVPEPAVVEPEPEPVQTQVPPDSLAEAAGDTAVGGSPGQGGTGTGGGRGSGTGTGEGSGIGPGRGGGTGGGDAGGNARGSAPVPRQLILPPFDYPADLRGTTIAVTFWVRANGRVARVALEPEIGDRGFAKRFREVMMAYRFRPARSPSGEAIEGTTTVSVSF